MLESKCSFCFAMVSVLSIIEGVPRIELLRIEIQGVTSWQFSQFTLVVFIIHLSIRTRNKN